MKRRKAIWAGRTKIGGYVLSTKQGEIMRTKDVGVIAYGSHFAEASEGFANSLGITLKPNEGPVRFLMAELEKS